MARENRFHKLGINDYVKFEDANPKYLTRNGDGSDNAGYPQAIRDQLVEITEAFLERGVTLRINWGDFKHVKYKEFKEDPPFEDKMECSFFPCVRMLAEINQDIEVVSDPTRDRFNERRYGTKTPSAPQDGVPVSSGAWPIQGRYESWADIFVATTGAIRDLIERKGSRSLEVLGMHVGNFGMGKSSYDELDLGLQFGNVVVDIEYDGRGIGGEGLDVLVPEKEDSLFELEKTLKPKAKNLQEQ